MSALPSTSLTPVREEHPLECLIPTVRVGIFHMPANESAITLDALMLPRWQRQNAEITIGRASLGHWPDYATWVDQHLLFLNQFIEADLHTRWQEMMTYVTHAMVFVSPDDTDLIEWLGSAERPQRPLLTIAL